MGKSALITGITGQDGSYLAELLLEKGYHVHGLRRRASTNNTERLNSIIDHDNFFMHYGDLTDAASLLRAIEIASPDEVYNLGAQSHVHASFEMPEYTANADAIGTLRLLEAIRLKNPNIKFYQASTSELYGLIQEPIQNESTPFYPRSPYGVAKLYSYWITVNYREAYNLYACNGILFNHESERRGDTFVTRKITKQLCEVLQQKREKIFLGNLDAERDWGHAEDYVEAQWLMLQQKHAKDYVIATGVKHSVRQFIEQCCLSLGISIKWSGEREEETALISDIRNSNISTELIGKTIIAVDPYYFRPSEVEVLLGDSSKAKKELGWKPQINFEKLVDRMIKNDWDA